jgi:hypothetical protein
MICSPFLIWLVILYHSNSFFARAFWRFEQKMAIKRAAYATLFSKEMQIT